MTSTVPAALSPEAMTATAAEIDAAEAHAAHNYHPLPIVVSDAEGAWVTDIAGKRYVDMLAGYSALNFGHRHPALIEAATAQLNRVTLTSRAFHHDRFAEFATKLAQLAGKDAILPMNTGAEAVETAIKVARKWGYQVKGVPDGQAKIVVAGGNFHGRTTTIVSFSSDTEAKNEFGPYTPGFVTVPYGDSAAAIAELADPHTVAILVEPIQGEAGVLVPPDDYLPALRAACDEHNVLLIADEVQSGLGRTGRTFACEHVGVVPDIYVLGKALGGGVVPVSAIVANWPVLGVLKPGEHGSTFGGNPLACAVGIAVVDLLATGEFQRRAAELGERLHAALATLPAEAVVTVRGRGLWAGVEFSDKVGSGRSVCERLAERGVLAKDTHGSTIRLAPPITIDEADLDWAVEQLRAVVS